MNKKLIQVYVDYKTTFISEVELIQTLNNWFEINQNDLIEECKQLFLKIQRLNTKTSDIKNAFPILKEIIDLIEPNFESESEPYYMTSLKKGCESLIVKKITPYELSQILTQVECKCDFPNWTGQLWNMLDRIEEQSPLEFYLIEEAKERITELNELLKTQYNTM